MTYEEFLSEVIERGKDGARRDYADSPAKLQGALDGFEACRGKGPDKLFELLRLARSYSHQARASVGAPDSPVSDGEYWKIRCFEAEVEWVCNAVSAILFNEGKPVIVPPTARAMILAADIVGVRPSKVLP